MSTEKRLETNVGGGLGAAHLYPPDTSDPDQPTRGYLTVDEENVVRFVPEIDDKPKEKE